MEAGTRSRRRRRPVESRCMPRRTLWCLGGLLVVVGGGAHAGRSDVSWSHAEYEELGATAMTVDAAGAMVITGCSVGGESFYVAKYSARGEPLWRQTVHAEALVDETTTGLRPAAACATALATDATLDLYVTGTLSRSADYDDDSDVFVARLSAIGSLVWTQTLGTLFADVATSVSIVEEATTTPSVLVGGYSSGNLSLGRAGPRNCAILIDCDDGFVVRLAAGDGTVVWVHTVATSEANRSGAETRVFDVVAVEGTNATAASVVVVGESRSSPTTSFSSSVFVRRLEIATGESLWTTQLRGSATASFCQQRAVGASHVPLYDREYPRGRCGVAVHGRSQGISAVGTTHGLLSTFPSQHTLYRDICGTPPTTPSSAPLCVQAFLARLDLESGTVLWVQQLVHAAHTTAERVVALGRKDATSSDAAMLATADAGFFTSAESMEQLAVVRVSGSDGAVQWAAELGLPGEDHAVALARDAGSGLVVAAHGSVDKSRRGQVSAQSWVRRVRASDGQRVPVCVDVVGFDTTRGYVPSNATRDKEEDDESPRWRLVQLPLRRDETMRCGDATATVRYRHVIGFNASRPSFSSGVVQFTSAQSTVSLALSVPRAATSLRVSLEAISDDTTVDATAMEWVVDLVERLPPVVVEDSGSGSKTADGRLWQQLTWLALVVAIAATALVVVGGRLVCWRSSAWSWRRAKAFEYTTLRLRRTTKPATAIGSSPPGPSTEETEELRCHLEEIQLLNESLDGLLLAPSPLATPRSPAVVVPAPPTHNKAPAWKRSLRRLLSPPLDKKRPDPKSTRKNRE